MLVWILLWAHSYWLVFHIPQKQAVSCHHCWVDEPPWLLLFLDGDTQRCVMIRHQSMRTHNACCEKCFVWCAWMWLKMRIFVEGPVPEITEVMLYNPTVSICNLLLITSMSLWGDFRVLKIIIVIAHSLCSILDRGCANGAWNIFCFHYSYVCCLSRCGSNRNVCTVIHIVARIITYREFF